MQKFAAGYHPFYITDDPEGGYEFKNAQERRKVMAFLKFKLKNAKERRKVIAFVKFKFNLYEN